MKSKILLSFLAVIFLLAFILPVQAQVTLTVQTLSINGLAASYSTARLSVENHFANDGKTFLHVKNVAAGGPTTVTIQSQVTNPPPGTSAANVQVTVADGAEKFIGPFNQAGYNDSVGKVQVTFSDTVGVTIAAIKLPISTP